MSLRDCSISRRALSRLRFLVLVQRKASLPAVLHHTADVLFAPALGESIAGRRVDQVDAEVEASLDDGNGDVEVVGLFDSGLRAE